MRLPTVVLQRERLMAWLDMFEYSRANLASQLGVSRGRITQLLTSRKEPSAHLIAKLLLLTNLPFERLFKVVNSSPEFPSTHVVDQPVAALRGGSPKP